MQLQLVLRPDESRRIISCGQKTFNDLHDPTKMHGFDWAFIREPSTSVRAKMNDKRCVSLGGGEAQSKKVKPTPIDYVGVTKAFRRRAREAYLRENLLLLYERYPSPPSVFAHAHALRPHPFSSSVLFVFFNESQNVDVCVNGRSSCCCQPVTTSSTRAGVFFGSSGSWHTRLPGRARSASSPRSMSCSTGASTAAIATASPRHSNSLPIANLH
jgi:hypothetical protein